MVKVKFEYAKSWNDEGFWKEKGIKNHKSRYVSNGEILDILSDLQSSCDAGGFKFKYYLKPNKDWQKEQTQGTLWVAVKRTTRFVQRPTKMMLIKVVLHKLEDVLELKW